MASTQHSHPVTPIALKAPFESIDPSLLVEEETLPTYKPHKFYPVRISETFCDRYHVIGKLGYGSGSTVWLCRDSLKRGFVALKVYVNTIKVNRELSIYQHLNEVRSEVVGQEFIRGLVDSFEIDGPHGRHLCLVHEPLGISLHELKQRGDGKDFPIEVLKPALRQLLIGLYYLHEGARVVHTDIQAKNCLIGLDNTSVLEYFEKKESEKPVPRKLLGDRTIYLSRQLRLTHGLPVICDLGEARLGDEEHSEDIMPDLYRAPEVILGMKWSYPVDMWSMALTTWHLFGQHQLFKAVNPEKQLDDAYHLAEMIAIMGPPPMEFLRRSDISLKFWDENGQWRGKAPIPDISLEKLEQRLEGEDKARYLRWIRGILRWMPEERSTAEEACLDEWLLEGLFGDEPADGPTEKLAEKPSEKPAEKPADEAIAITA